MFDGLCGKATPLIIARFFAGNHLEILLTSIHIHAQIGSIEVAPTAESRTQACGVPHLSRGSKGVDLEINSAPCLPDLEISDG